MQEKIKLLTLATYLKQKHKKQLVEKKDQEVKIFKMQTKISENESRLSSLEEELVDNNTSALNSKYQSPAVYHFPTVLPLFIH